jgi:radical SAM protein with 4Fe4S-binding SPASM domain
MSAPIRNATQVLMERFKGSPWGTVAMIEIADRCNETCVHCYQVQGQKGEMSNGDWKQIIDELADMGVLLLVISGGEATLRPDFLDLVAYARKKKFGVKVYTNGLSMTRELAQALAKLAVTEVHISLYSRVAESHDWVTGVPGSFDRTVQAIRFLAEEGVTVVAKTPVMNINANDIPGYIDFVTELGASYVIDANISPRETGERDPEGLLPTEEELLRALREPRVGFPMSEAELPPRSLEAHPCGPCQTVHIEANGEVRPCGLLNIPLGDAITDGVRNTELTDEAQFLRTVQWADLRGCRACDLRAYCQRCHSDAQINAGDAFSPYAKACGRALTRFAVRHGETAVVVGERREGEAAVGPFRRLERGRYEAFEDPLTEDDRLARDAHPWIVNTTSGPVEPARPGQLVQLRRPGRKTPIREAVPGAPGNKTPAQECV